MGILIFIVLLYSMIWFSGLGFLMRRISLIRRRTEKRVLDFDGQYIMPIYKKPWIFTGFCGLIAYIFSVLVIIFFLK